MARKARRARASATGPPGIEGHPSGARKVHESVPALHPGVPWRDPKKCFRIPLSSAASPDLFAE
jgi:hypothetical protein